MDCSFATGGANTITRKTNIGGFGPAVLVTLYLLWAPTDPRHRVLYLANS